MTSKPINDSCQSVLADAQSTADIAASTVTPAQNAGVLAAENQLNNNPNVYLVWPEPDSGKNPYGQH